MSTAGKSDQEPGSVIDCIQGMRGKFKAQINEISTTVQEIKSKIVAVNNTISAIQKSKAEMEEVQQKTSNCREKSITFMTQRSRFRAVFQAR